MRNDSKFDHFWENVEVHIVRINVDVVEPAVPRKRKVSARSVSGAWEWRERLSSHCKGILLTPVF